MDESIKRWGKIYYHERKEIAYAIKIRYEANRVIECRCKFEFYIEMDKRRW